MKKFKRILATSLVSIFALTGCGDEQSDGKNNETADSGVIVVKMPSYRTAENSGAKLFEPQVERFNELYEDKYKIELEVTSDATHADVIKNLANQDKLPVVFQFADYTYAEEILFNEDTLLNLKPWLDETNAIKDIFLDEQIDFVTHDDGNIYALPISVIRPTGMYVNENVYSPSTNVRDMTWDQLGQEMRDANTTYGFQNVNGGWTINLTTVAIMGSLDGGKEILEAGTIEKINDFNKPEWIETFTIMKDFYDQAGWSGGLGKDYPDVENAFINNVVGVMPNGQWIIDVFNEEGSRATDWGEGFDGANVTGTIFPNNVAIANPNIYDWYISANATEEEQELALAFLEFINSPAELEAMMLAEGGANSKITYSDEFNQALSENKLMTDFANATDENTLYVPYLHEIVTDSTMSAISNNIPLLFTGSITPEEFCDEVTRYANE